MTAGLVIPVLKRLVEVIEFDANMFPETRTPVCLFPSVLSPTGPEIEPIFETPVTFISIAKMLAVTVLLT